MKIFKGGNVMKRRIGKVMALMLCVMTLLSFPAATMAGTQPSGTVGDDYYMFKTMYASNDRYNITYNGELVQTTSGEGVNYNVEITPMILGNPTPIGAVVRSYRVDGGRRGSDMNYLYFENLPYPGTKYWYTIRRNVLTAHDTDPSSSASYTYTSEELIVESGSFTTTGATPAWIANSTSGGSGSTSASGNYTYTVIANQAFSVVMSGELTGSVNGVTAASTAGTGYTTLSGTLATAGVQKVVIGSTQIFFKVIPAPTNATLATVSFGS